MTKVTNIQYKKLLKTLLKASLFVFLFIITLFSSILIALQFPAVQTRLVQKAAEFVTETLHYPTSIKAVDISWFDKISLREVSISDKQHNQMIFVDDAEIDFSISSILQPSLTIDEVILKNGRVKLYKFSSDSTVNITEFIEAIREVTTPKQRTGPPKAFEIADVRLENMFFSYYDQRKNLITKGFDYYHFSFENINAKVTDLRVIADTFQIRIDDLTAMERQTKLEIKETNLDFLVSKYNMLFENIDANIGKSKLNENLKFNYSNINDLTEFNEKIVINATLDSSLVYSQDLAHFAPQLKPFVDYATVSGDFTGTVTNFTVKDLGLSFGQKSHIAGRATFKGLPEVEETYIDFKFNNSKVNAKDLKQYFPASTYKVLTKFDNINGTGEFVGFPYDFVTHGKFNTGLGKLDSDLNFKILENENPKSKYSGSLTTYGFNLGKFVDEPKMVGLIDMNGKLDGKGLTLSEAEINLDATISRIGLNGYDYKNIVTNAKLSNELFDGEISINDPNLVINANGLINLKNNANKFDIKASFEKANLKPLHITDHETLIVSDFNLNFTGLTPDEIVGEVTFSNTYLLYMNNRELFIDSLYAESTKSGDLRQFHLNSDLLSANAHGDFEFTQLYDDIKKLYTEYELNIKNDKDEIDRYYKSKRKELHPKYNVDFAFHLKDLNHLFSVYAPGLYLSENTKIKGEFSNGYTSILNMVTHFDTLFYQEHEIYKTDIEISTSKLADSADVLAMLYINSPNQALKGFPKTENFFLEGIWNGGEIDFSTRVKQKDSQNKIDLNGYLSLERNKQKILALTRSNVNLLNKNWTVSENNRIYFTKEGIIFNDFGLVNQDQYLHLEGMLSNDPKRIANVDVKNFDLENLNPILTNVKLSGKMNSALTLQNIFKDLNVSGDVTVDTLMVDGFLIGNVVGHSGWNQSLKRLDVNIDVSRKDINVVGINGFVKQDPKNNQHELNLDAKLQNANLDILNPIFKGVLSDVKGAATGNFKIEGDTKNIIVKGKADVKDAQFTIDYLKTTYFFDDYIYMDENLIGFRKLKLKDSYGDIAVVNGGIYHDNFTNFLVELKAYVDNFQVLNTTEKDNELFYGNAFVSGDIELTGSFSDLKINANAVSNKGTRIYIPITQYAGLEQQSYIRFKTVSTANNNKKTSGKKKDKVEEDKIDLSGIKMEFNLDITPDAYAEIIFDKRAGDIIRGNGSGNLKLEIDTRGDFFIYGTYQMVKGAYNFTLANLINKEFSIEPNSSITWYGDPYEGQLNINATYRQSASIAPFIPIELDSTLYTQEALKRYPVDVQMGITGNLLSPDIDLGIKIKNYSGNAASYVTQFEATIDANEQELNRQVFSLLVLGGFSSATSFSGVGTDGTSNLSELLTNQLGNWLSQVDENLQVDMDLRGLDREALNTFNLRLSYTMLDGRLRISRDGNFTNVQDPNQSNFTNIAGEWTIEYLLSQDGKLRLKLYNKNVQNQLMSTSVNNGTNTQAGFSILHTETFDSLGDLLKKKKEKPATAENFPKDSTPPVRKEDESPANKEDE